MTKPQNIIVDGVMFVRVEGHITVNGKVFVPVSSLPADYRPPPPPLSKELNELAHQVRVLSDRKQGGVTVNALKRILSRNVPHNHISSFIELAVDAGYIQRVPGTSGDTAEYLPVNIKGN